MFYELNTLHSSEYIEGVRVSSQDKLDLLGRRQICDMFASETMHKLWGGGDQISMHNTLLEVLDLSSVSLRKYWGMVKIYYEIGY